MNKKQKVVFAVVVILSALIVIGTFGAIIYALKRSAPTENPGYATAKPSVMPTATPSPAKFDPYGRFHMLGLTGDCQIVTTWETLPGVWVRNHYGPVEYSGDTVSVTYTAFPAVILKDDVGQTWAVDFSYDPIRVYAQGSYFWAGIATNYQIQPVNPAPFILQAQKTVPNHALISVYSEWRWENKNNYYGWTPINSVCIEN